MRILITEEALATQTGHWATYIGGIARGLRRCGDVVDVLTHRDASPDLLDLLEGTPCYSRSCWTDVRSQGRVGGLMHNRYFRRETLRHLRRKGPYDRLLSLTTRLQHLVAFASMTRSRHRKLARGYLLLFVQGFASFSGPDNAPIFRVSASNLLARLAFRYMKRAVQRRDLVLAAETRAMQRELQQFTRLPVSLWPHPIELAERSPRISDTCDGTRPRRLTVACPGFARYEKGTDLLQNAIIHCLSEAHSLPIRFVLQWPSPFPMPNGDRLTPDPFLLRHPEVELIDRALSPPEYETLLRRSDFVILPYRREAYHNRLSRVAIEAATHGIPLIYMSGTWTEELTALTGAGIPISDESPYSISHALKRALECHHSLRSQACKSAQAVTTYHSTTRFRELLCTEFA